MNAVSMKPYRGINHWLTLITQDVMGYQDPRWLTFKQARDLGGTVRKGEKGSRIVFWKMIPRKKGDPEDEDNVFPLLRSYTVFNLEQTEGCDVPDMEPPELRPETPVELAEAIIRDMPDPPEIVTYLHDNRPPRYYPARDRVMIPEMGRYENADYWYNTMFHELTHSTGHPKRLDRFKKETRHGELHNYGREELVAAMGSAMLGARAGIGSRVLELDASYIRHWRDAIAADKAMVVRAATLAQKSTDWILGEREQ